jgi:deoxyribonuclease-1-like protein
MLNLNIRPRWPILTAVGAALLYGVNNYQIAGIEHLHLKPLDQQSSPNSSQSPLAAEGSNQNPLGFDLTQFGIHTSPALNVESGGSQGIDPYSAQPQTRSGTWNELLTLGERLALWQDQLSERSTTTTSSSAVGTAGVPPLHLSSPIPVPQGSHAPNFNLSPAVDSVGHNANPSSQPVLPLSTEGIPSGTMTSVSVSPSAGSSGMVPFSAVPGGINTPRETAQTIRIASFKVPALGTAILSKPQSVQMLISILRQYDVVAVQGIQTNRDDVLPLLIDKLNQSGRSYDYLIGPRVGRNQPHQQFAYVFDTSRLETDRYQLYTVDDPEDLMHNEPLVAWFRCKGPPIRDAFTFSLINVAIEPAFADVERSLLPAMIAAIERDGRNEDDWILLGDFYGGNAQLTMFDRGSVRFAVSDIPTDVAGTQMLDTLLFSSRSTTEFTGRAGAFDFLRKYNLSIEQALELSPHMPVWAEFSCFEGADPGRIAPANANIQ